MPFKLIDPSAARTPAEAQCDVFFRISRETPFGVDLRPPAGEKEAFEGLSNAKRFSFTLWKVIQNPETVQAKALRALAQRHLAGVRVGLVCDCDGRDCHGEVIAKAARWLAGTMQAEATMKIAEGINIASPYKGRNTPPLGAALTNVTFAKYTIAPDRLPGLAVPSDGSSAEHWYKANKTGHLQGDLMMMARIIEAKLLQYPKLVQEIQAHGGQAWLARCQHTVGSAYSRWEGEGLESNFIKALIHGYVRATGETLLPEIDRRIRVTAPLLVVDKPVFVFGSNLSGRHGKGAARDAARFFGAIEGQGVGAQGAAYAIPTKDENLKTLPLSAVAGHVDAFIDYAWQHPGTLFAVTRIGCGLAGYQDEEVAPLFKHAPGNCLLPGHWERCLNRDANPVRRVVIAGSRDFDDQDALFEQMEIAHAKQPFTQVISGDARGADKMGEAWAKKQGIPVIRYPADWNNPLMRKAAGFVRNHLMGSYGTDLHAFWDGHSPGTKDMVEFAKQEGLDVTVHTPQSSASKPQSGSMGLF